MTEDGSLGLSDGERLGLPVAAGFSLAALAIFFCFYRVLHLPSLRRHPNWIYSRKLAMEAVLYSQFLIVPLLGEGRLYDEERDRASSLAAFLAFLTQVSYLGGELWVAALAYDLHVGVTNPFRTFSQYKRAMSATVYSVALLSGGILLLLGPNVYGPSSYGVCWIMTKNLEDEFHRWIFGFLPALLVYSYSLGVVVLAKSRLRGLGLPSTLKARRNFLSRSSTYISCHCAFWIVPLALSIAEGVLIGFYPGSSRPHADSMRTVVIFMAACRGVASLVFVGYVNRDEIGIVWADQKILEQHIADEMALRPHLNSVLRAEVLHYTTSGMVKALRAFEAARGLEESRPRRTDYSEDGPAAAAGPSEESGKPRRRRTRWALNLRGASKEETKLVWVQAADSEDGGRFVSAPNDGKKDDKHESYAEVPAPATRSQKIDSVQIVLASPTAAARGDEADAAAPAPAPQPYEVAADDRDETEAMEKRLRKELRMDRKDSELREAVLPPMDPAEDRLRHAVAPWLKGAAYVLTLGEGRLSDSAAAGAPPDTVVTYNEAYVHAAPKGEEGDVEDQSDIMTLRSSQQDSVEEKRDGGAVVQRVKRKTRKSSMAPSTPKHTADLILGGAASTHRVEFTDYAPGMFQHIRASCGVSEEAYAKSLSAATREKFSEGKSGAFLYFTADMRYIVKTANWEEVTVLLGMLDGYLAHLDSNPASLLVRIFGAHSLRIYGQTIHVIVMRNIIKPGTHIDEMYDLKGSWVGRHSGSDLSKRKKGREWNRGLKSKRGTLKDLDLTYRLHLRPSTSRRLAEQLLRDSLYLAENHIMDYSLLLGVQRGTFRIRKSGRDHVAMPTTNAGTPGDFSREEKDGALRAKQSNETRDGTIQLEDYLELDAAIVEGPERYFMGIIDILQRWNTWKRIERLFKIYVTLNDRDGISVMQPEPYQERFMERAVFDVIEGYKDRGSVYSVRSNSGIVGTIRAFAHFQG